MPNQNQYETLTEALIDLKKRGYVYSFEVIGHKAFVRETNETIDPENMTIVEYHRFEGDSNPDDMSVVYAIETTSGLKGVMIDAFGTYSSEELSSFLSKVKIKKA